MGDEVGALLEESTVAGPGTLRRLARAELGAMLYAGLAALIYSTCQVIQPVVLAALLALVEAGRAASDMPRLIPVFMGLQIVAALANHWQMHIAAHVGQRLRAQLVGLIFQKAMRVSPSQRLPSGRVVNLMANDAQKFVEALPFFHKLWSAPLQIVLASYFLVSLVGKSALLGVAVLMTLVPLSRHFSLALQRFRSRHMAIADVRVRLCIEMLTGVRCIKYFAWERPYLSRIFEKRREELHWALRELLIYGASMIFTVIGPNCAFAVTLLGHLFLEGEGGITASRSFGTLALMNGLRFPIMDMGSMLATLVSLWASWQRLGDFLDRQESPPISSIDGDIQLLQLQGCSFGYPDEMGVARAAVSGLDMAIRAGELVIIEGRVGSGKSTVMQGILGEAELLGGTLSAQWPVAYCPQHPWVLNATIRENILFGNAYEVTWYQQVVQACCLDLDIRQLLHGDNTEVGERGVTLSGGQKQRVALARAVYHRECKLVLLDDVFSALDAHTGHQVLDALLGLPGGLLRNRGVLLAAHCFTAAELAQQVLTLTTSASGPGSICTVRCERAEPQCVGQRPLADLIEDASGEAEEVVPLDGSTKADVAGGSKLLMSDEERSVGGVSWQCLRMYLASLGGPFWTMSLLIVVILERVFFCGQDWWLATWTAEDPGSERPAYYLGVYGIIFALSFAFVSASRTLIAFLNTWAARSLFEQMAVRVMRAPVSWWDTTPLGRVLNRFSFDTEMVDATLLTKLFPALMSLSWILGAVAVMGGVLWPYSLLAVPVPTAMYLWLFQFSRKSIRELQRIDSITRSPIQSVFVEALHGLASIRAYQSEARYRAVLAGHINTNSGSILAFNTASRWLGVRLECLAGGITGAAAVGCWLLIGNLTPGLVGLCLLWSTVLTVSLNFNCQFWSQAEAAFTSVERIVQYATEIPVEGLHQDLDGWTGHGCPAVRLLPSHVGGGSRACLCFEEVSLRYREGLPLALSAVSFEMSEGERMAVVGRTGAGKSSLAVALFRLAPLSSGRVLLGGTDLRTLPLDVARKSLGIITQDPVIFSGTVRYNLDPFEECSDEDCRAALEQAQLAGKLQLDSEVQEAGANRSVGERQLMCLARALLRKPRLLLCDEATSSVDTQTDEQVQVCLRSVSSALLTIAHRLATIADYDRVMVMETGRVIELGPPHLLLSDQGGAFLRLVQRAGAAQAQVIRRAAERATARPRGEAELLLERPRGPGAAARSALCALPLLRLTGCAPAPAARPRPQRKACGAFFSIVPEL